MGMLRLYFFEAVLLLVFEKRALCRPLLGPAKMYVLILNVIKRLLKGSHKKCCKILILFAKCIYF